MEKVIESHNGTYTLHRQLGFGTCCDVYEVTMHSRTTEMKVIMSFCGNNRNCDLLARAGVCPILHLKIRMLWSRNLNHKLVVIQNTGDTWPWITNGVVKFLRHQFQSQMTNLRIGHHHFDYFANYDPTHLTVNSPQVALKRYKAGAAYKLARDKEALVLKLVTERLPQGYKCIPG